MLVEHGLLTKADDPSHKQKVTYSLTEQAIELVPVFVQVGAWGTRHLQAGEDYAARGEVLAAGGPPAREAFIGRTPRNPPRATSPPGSPRRAAPP